MIFDVWQFEVWLLPYIRPLVQVIPAGPDEIRRKSPYLFGIALTLPRLHLQQAEYGEPGANQSGLARHA